MNRDLDHLRLLSIFHYIFAGLTAFGACIITLYLGIAVMVFGWIEVAVEEEAARQKAEAIDKAEAAVREHEARAEQLHQAVEQEHGDQNHAPAENRPPLEATRPGAEPGLPAVPAEGQGPANGRPGLQPGGAEEIPAPAADHAEAGDHGRHEPELPEFIPKAFAGLFGAIAVAQVVLSLLVTVLLIMAARSLSAHKSHTFCLVIGALECLSIPFGTILGVFTLIVLMRPSVKVLFGVMDRSALPAGYDDLDDY